MFQASWFTSWFNRSWSTRASFSVFWLHPQTFPVQRGEINNKSYYKQLIHCKTSPMNIFVCLSWWGFFSFWGSMRWKSMLFRKPQPAFTPLLQARNSYAPHLAYTGMLDPPNTYTHHHLAINTVCRASTTSSLLTQCLLISTISGPQAFGKQEVGKLNSAPTVEKDFKPLRRQQHAYEKQWLLKQTFRSPILSREESNPHNQQRIGREKPSFSIDLSVFALKAGLTKHAQNGRPCNL